MYQHFDVLPLQLQSPTSSPWISAMRRCCSSAPLICQTFVLPSFSPLLAATSRSWDWRAGELQCSHVVARWLDATSSFTPALCFTHTLLTYGLWTSSRIVYISCVALASFLCMIATSMFCTTCYLDNGSRICHKSLRTGGPPGIRSSRWCCFAEQSLSFKKAALLFFSRLFTAHKGSWQPVTWCDARVCCIWIKIKVQHVNGQIPSEIADKRAWTVATHDKKQDQVTRFVLVHMSPWVKLQFLLQNYTQVEPTDNLCPGYRQGHQDMIWTLSI